MPVLDGNFEAYVTNLGKYNEGALVGEWVKFPTTEEEMQKVYERIGIGSKDDFGNPYEEKSSLRIMNARYTAFMSCLVSMKASTSSTTLLPVSKSWTSGIRRNSLPLWRLAAMRSVTLMISSI